MASFDQDDDSTSLADDPSYDMLRSVRAMKEEGNRAFNNENFGKAAEHYRSALRVLEDSDEFIVNSTFLDGPNDDVIRALRVTLNSNLAEAYLRLGLWFLAEQHCRAALDIDEEHEKSSTRLKNAQESMTQYNERVGRFELISVELGQSKSSKDMRRMMKLTQELADTSDSRKNDPKLICRSLLAQADSQLMLAQALLYDPSTRPSGVARISAVDHLSRSSELCHEVLRCCSGYRVDSYGYDSSDVSVGATHSRWLTCLHSAQAWLMIGRTCMAKEMERASLVPSELSEWDTSERAILYFKLDAAIMNWVSGINEVELCEDEHIPVDLKAHRMHLEIEILTELMAAELIGGQTERVREHAERISQVVHRDTHDAMGAQDVDRICSKISSAYVSLGPIGARNSSTVWPIAQTLLYACAHARKMAKMAEKEARVYLEIIRARRLSWSLAGVVADACPPTQEEALADTSDTQCLIESLRKTGREIDDACPICMEPLLSGSVVQILECRHLFHQHCCKRYFKDMISPYDVQRAQSGQLIMRSMPCPTCRSQQSFTISPFGDVLD